MATRYWVGGTGVWSSTNTTNWSASSGGAGGASVPTSSDDVIFDSNSSASSYSFYVQDNYTAVCKSLTISDPATGQVTSTTGFVGDIAIYNGDVAITSTGSLGGLPIAYTNSSANGTYNISSTANLYSLRLAGGATATYNLGAALSVNYLTVSKGTINFGAGPYTISDTLSTNTVGDTVVINLGSATINGLNRLEVYGTNTTFNAGTSTIVAATGSGVYIGRSTDPASTPITLNNFTCVYLDNDPCYIYNQVTFNNLTLDFSASTQTRVPIYFYADSTITNLSITGEVSPPRRPFICSDTQGTTRTLTVTSASVDYADFQDITIAGAAAPISGTMLGDCGGNTDITFPASKNVYWNQAGGGNWTDTAWAATSGGAVADTNFPLPQDTAIIENTGLNTSADIDFVYANISSIDGTTRTLAYSLSFDTGVIAAYCYGDFKPGNSLSSGLSSYPVYFYGGRTQVVTVTPDNRLYSVVVEKIPSAVFQLGSNITTLSASAVVTFNSGTIDLNGFTYAFGSFILGATGTKTISGTSGTIKLYGTGTIFTGNNASVTVSVPTTLSLTGATASSRTLIDGINSPNFNVDISPSSGSTGAIILDDNFYCGDLTFGNNFRGDLTIGTASSDDLTVYGNFTFSTYSLATITLYSVNSTFYMNPPSGTTVTFDPKGKSIANGYFQVSGEDITSVVNLASNLTTTDGGVRIYSGVFNSNSYTINTKYFTSAYTTGLPREVNIGTSSITFGNGITSGNATPFSMTDGNATLTFTYTSGAELRAVAVSTGNIYFNGGGKSYPKLTLAGAGTTLTIADNNTFENITNTAQPATLKITSGTTQTVAAFDLSGTAGNLVTLTSTTTSQHTLASSSGLDVSVNYLDISYSNAGGIISTQWYANTTSTNSGNNTGWQFVAPPPPPKGQFFMIMLG